MKDTNFSVATTTTQEEYTDGLHAWSLLVTGAAVWRVCVDGVRVCPCVSPCVHVGPRWEWKLVSPGLLNDILSHRFNDPWTSMNSGLPYHLEYVLLKKENLSLMAC